MSIWESSRDLDDKSEREPRSPAAVNEGNDKARAKAPKSAESGGLKWDRRTLRFAVVGLAVLVALIAWLATRGGGDESSEPASSAEAAAVRIVNTDELREAAAELGQPIYWAGPMPGKELELKELAEGGGAQVRYLAKGTAAGEGSRAALTIGSYPLEDPDKALEGFAARPGATTRKASDGREVVVGRESPSSVYFVSPENSVQVEVYDPAPQRAMSLALSGTVEPAG